MNHYQTLDVPEDVDGTTLKKAFRKIARECHPDVAGDDPKCAARFKVAREAFETLSDPQRRARYDRRRRRMASKAGVGSFFDAFYRATGRGEASRSPPSPGKSSAAAAPAGRGNDVNLDDLFDDFGDFGFGSSKPPSSFTQSTSTLEEDPRSRRGEDVRMDFDVPKSLAKKGGSMPLSYERLDRSDMWSPGMDDPGLVAVQDVVEIRVIPGTCEGEILREKGRGNAGPHGGPCGDLVLMVRFVGEETPRTPPVPGVVEISLGEALLGGTVAIQSPTGPVNVDIPPGTSGGTRLRIRGKGPSGADWYVVTRVLVPEDLDEEGRALAAKLAERYPGGR